MNRSLNNLEVGKLLSGSALMRVRIFKSISLYDMSKALNIGIKFLYNLERNSLYVAGNSFINNICGYLNVSEDTLCVKVSDLGLEDLSNRVIIVEYSEELKDLTPSLFDSVSKVTELDVVEEIRGHDTIVDSLSRIYNECQSILSFQCEHNENYVNEILALRRRIIALEKENKELKTMNQEVNNKLVLAVSENERIKREIMDVLNS